MFMNRLINPWLRVGGVASELEKFISSVIEDAKEAQNVRVFYDEDLPERVAVMHASEKWDLHEAVYTSYFHTDGTIRLVGSTKCGSEEYRLYTISNATWVGYVDKSTVVVKGQGYVKEVYVYVHGSKDVLNTLLSALDKQGIEYQVTQ